MYSLWAKAVPPRVCATRRVVYALLFHSMKEGRNCYCFPAFKANLEQLAAQLLPYLTQYK